MGENEQFLGEKVKRSSENDVFDDKNPKLGGNVNVNGFSIVSLANGDILITPNGTGEIILDGLKWPQADGTAGQPIVTDGAGQLSFATGVFTENFVSSEQTLTAQGTLTLAHSLSSKPLLMSAHIICKTAEFGYSIGDEVEVSNILDAANNGGFSMHPDATNLEIQYGQLSTVFRVLKRSATVGQTTNITAANWKFVAKAWA